MAADPELSVVIPVYRSEGYLERTVDELVTSLEGWDFEIVLVNDGSPDQVQRVIDTLHARDPRIRFLELGTNGGQHAAVLRGFAVARGDIVVSVDDDGQNPPSAVLAVASALKNGEGDVVYGRFLTVEQHVLRRLASATNLWLFRYTIGNQSGVTVSNVRALRGDLARCLGATETIFPYIDSMIFRATRRIAEVEIEHRPRADGRSTYRVRDLFRLWLSHMSTLTVLPLKLATAGSFSIAGLGFILGIAQLLRALLLRRAPAGWLSLYLTVTLLFSVLFAFMGILSAYLGRLYVSQNARGLTWTRSTGLAASPSTRERPRPRTVGGER